MKKICAMLLLTLALATLGACGERPESPVPIPEPGQAAAPPSAADGGGEAAVLLPDEAAAQAVTIIRGYLEDSENVTLAVVRGGDVILDGEACYAFQAVDDQPEKMQSLGFFAFPHDMCRIYRMDELTGEYELLEDLAA